MITRKVYSTLIVLFVAILSTFTQGSSAKENNVGATIVNEVATDYIKYENENEYARCIIAVDYPQDANSDLGKAIIGFFKENLINRNDYCDYDDMGELIADRSSESAEIKREWSSGNEMISYYGNKYFIDYTDGGILGEDIHDDEEWQDPNEEYKYFKETLINKIYETNELVSYEYKDCWYTGGERGWCCGDYGWGYDYGITFLKADAKKLDWSIFEDVSSIEFKKFLAKAIIENLNDYIKKRNSRGDLEEDYKELKNDDDLIKFMRDNFKGEDFSLGDINVPEHLPIATYEGIKFTYEMYELIPEPRYFVVPYDMAKDFLTEQYRELLYP